MPDIKQLPPLVVNQIAAGEVIERPASVVKELLENSIDAGARRIEVSVAQGGSELVRVADDGCGIAPQQLPLAVASHATSKISDADDLFHVGTLGFRGEALASIAAVSRLTLRTRPGDATGGHQLEVSGGAVGQVAPCGCPVGTTIEVRHLFFNTPVRRKFMRTTQTEMGHIGEAVTRAALAFPQIHFTLRHNDKLVHELPAVESWRDRIATFFGGDLAAGLIPVESSDGEVRLTGYAAEPNFSRGNNRMQYLFLNGRHIKDRALQHALGEAYRGLLLTGRYPIAFLTLDMPPELVDVNVHPAKLEVRFLESGRIYSQLLGTLRKKFLTTDLTAKVDAGPMTQTGVEPVAAATEAATAHDAQTAVAHRRDLVDWAKGQLGAANRTAEVPQPAADMEQAELELAFNRSPPLEITRLDRSWPAAGPQQPSSRTEQAEHLPTQPNGMAPGPPAMQVHNRYLIAEDESGVVVIDQHALHERIIYEQLRGKVLRGAVETQRLLVPETVHLSAAEAAAALDAQQTLSQLGIEVEPFGGDTVLVSAYPAMLANISPGELLRQVVEQLTSGEKAPNRRDLLDDLLHTISCKAAVKAGDKLSREEVAALVEQRHLCQDAHHCPHGRPTALVFTREELDRRFMRT